MPPGRGDLQGAAGDRLAADVGELRRRRFVDAVERPRIVGERRLAAQRRHDLVERGGDMDRLARGDVSLGRRHGGHDGVDVAEDRDHRRDPRHPAQGPVEAELADEPEPAGAVRRELLGGDEHADGDRQVETGTDLAQARGRQVDRDRLRRPVVAGAHHGRTDPVARLPARRVGLPDDAEAR